MSTEPPGRGPDRADLPVALRAAYRHCGRIAARHGRTYHLATALLPRARRPHVWALYAFARTADDLVDRPTGDPEAALQAWADHELALLRSPGPPDPTTHPVAAATWHTMRVHGLDVALWEEFATSMRLDLTVTRYPTFLDLRRYMRGSAAVIGELMAPVLGAHDPAALEPAGRLGEAFQLTNFVRDVAEDWLLGRLYLPLEDLRTAGATEADVDEAVRTGRPGRAARDLVLLEVERAFGLYEEARRGLTLVDPAAQPCLTAAFELYREIAVRAARADGDVFAGRIVVPRTRRLLTAARLMTRLGSRRPG